MIKYDIEYTVIRKSGEKQRDQKFVVELDDNTTNWDAIAKLRNFLREDGYINFWCQEIDSIETEDTSGAVNGWKVKEKIGLL